MPIHNTIELRREAGQCVTEARKILDKAEKEKRDLTQEEQQRWDALHEEADAKIGKADRIEKQERAEAGFGETPDKPVTTQDGSTGAPEDETPDVRTSEDALKEQRDIVFQACLRGGVEKLKPEQRSVLEQMNAEVRATLQQDNDIGGGFFAASEIFISRLLAAVDSRLVIRELATSYVVNRGDTLGVPTLDSDISEFEFGGGELTDASEDTGLALGKRELKPRDMKAKVVKISRPLLQNSKLDIEQIVVDRVSYQLAAGLETAYMTGAGAIGPLGLFTASDDGIGTARDVNTGNATGFTADGLIDAQGTLDDAYDTNARWLFHKDAITAIRKLKDGDGQYIWQPGLALGTNNQILGKPYVKGGKVPSTFTNGLYAGMYGDFSYYWIADAASIAIQRLVELYAVSNQIGLLFNNVAADGMPVLAEAFVRLKCAA